MFKFTLSETKYALFAVLPSSVTPKESGAELVKRLLTNNADSQKALSASKDLLGEVAKIPKAKLPEFLATMLDVTVAKPLGNIHAVEGTSESDVVYRYTPTIKQLVRRATAIVELFASETDVLPEVVKPGSKTGGRKQGGSLASGLVSK